MPKTKTINLRIDEEKLVRIDALAAKANQSRSEYMVQAALREPYVVGLDLATGPDRTETHLIMVQTPADVPAAVAKAIEGHPPGPGRCPRCNAQTIPWGPGVRRCRTCERNFSAG